MRANLWGEIEEERNNVTRRQNAWRWVATLQRLNRRWRQITLGVPDRCFVSCILIILIIGKILSIFVGNSGYNMAQPSPSMMKQRGNWGWQEYRSMRGRFTISSTKDTLLWDISFGVWIRWINWSSRGWEFTDIAQWTYEITTKSMLHSISQLRVLCIREWNRESERSDTFLYFCLHHCNKHLSGWHLFGWDLVIRYIWSWKGRISFISISVFYAADRMAVYKQKTMQNKSLRWGVSVSLKWRASWRLLQS